ncbi:MAG: four-carbon acid sugar kinase family protein [Chloroflexi bacterium]|nr:four-carbon acid sugar kinase family protein [Chloroflexota bacterium]
MPIYALIADDLTGALDAGAGFARAGLRGTMPFSGLPEDAGEADVVLVNTTSREGRAEEARRAAKKAAAHLRDAGIPRVYKKIDSVLRGYPGAELAGVLDVYGGRAAVAPAFPAQGRTTARGIQYVHGQPVSPYGGDLRAALGDAADRCDVFDAESDDDLARIAGHLAAQPEYCVWCGTAGLARYVPEALQLKPGLEARALPPPRAERVVVIAGTAHPTTAAQMNCLLAAGWQHVRLDLRSALDDAAQPALREALSRFPSSGRLLISTIGGLTVEEVAALHAGPAVTGDRIVAMLRAAACALRLEPGTGLIMTGGETAYQVCRALGAFVIHVTGEALPGIPLGWLELPQGTYPVATKSGGFGVSDALLRTADALVMPLRD